MDRGAVRREQRAEVRRAADARPRLVGLEHPVVVLAETEAAMIRELFVEAREVRRQASRPRGCRRAPSRSRCPRRCTTRSISSSVANIARCIAIAASRPWSRMVRSRAPGEQRRAPATVAARRAEADVLAFADDDTQRRIGAAQRVRGPQARVAGADDGDVGIDIARQRRPRRARRAESVRPEADHAPKYAPPHDPFRSA